MRIYQEPEDKVNCCECGEAVPTSEAYYYDEGILCEWCRDIAIVCCKCGDAVDKEDARQWDCDRYVEGEPAYCEACYENDYPTCQGCGADFPKEELIEMQGEYYCEVCQEDCETKS